MSSKMSVVVVDTTLAGPIIGGAQTFLADFATGLVAEGMAVHLVTAGEPESRIANFLPKSGAAVYKSLWPSPALVEDVTPIFAQWVNDLNPDIYCVSVSPDVGWTVLPCLRPDIATLAIAHGDSATFFRPICHYTEFLTRVVGVSQTVCDHIQEECGISAGRVVWIPYGVYAGNCPSAPPEPDSSLPIRIVYAGRLTDSQKRASDVIRIVERLRDISVDYRLSIVGDGPLRPDFERGLGPEIAGGKVKLHGWLERLELHRILDQGEVFLLTSDSEGFPIALVEAMSHGLAPIVTDIPSGNRQLVRHMGNGILVPVGGIDGFVRGVGNVARNRSLLRSLRVSAWHAAQPFTMRRMIDAYVECFATAMDQARVLRRKPDPAFPLMERCRSRYPLWLRRLKLSVSRVAQ